jgi:hypothetical protein
MTTLLKSTMMIVSILIGISSLTAVNAEEPKRPVPKSITDPEKAAQVLEMQELPINQVFERLIKVGISGDKDFLVSAIFAVFDSRKFQGINYSVERLKKPRRELIDGEVVDRSLELYVARKILEMFPDESIGSLFNLYEQADPATRVNIIFALGNMEGDPAIGNLLLAALDDQAFYQAEDVEIEGEPLRVCDEAYNQLVLRYTLRNILRTIGNAHAIEDRDYHIEILKSLF